MSSAAIVGLVVFGLLGARYGGLGGAVIGIIVGIIVGNVITPYIDRPHRPKVSNSH